MSRSAEVFQESPETQPPSNQTELASVLSADSPDMSVEQSSPSTCEAGATPCNQDHMMRSQPDLGGCDAAQAGGEGVSISGNKGQPVATTSSKDHPHQPGAAASSIEELSPVTGIEVGPVSSNKARSPVGVEVAPTSSSQDHSPSMIQQQPSRSSVLESLHGGPGLWYHQGAKGTPRARPSSCCSNRKCCGEGGICWVTQKPCCTVQTCRRVVKIFSAISSFCFFLCILGVKLWALITQT